MSNSDIHASPPPSRPLPVSLCVADSIASAALEAPPDRVRAAIHPSVVLARSPSDLSARRLSSYLISSCFVLTQVLLPEQVARAGAVVDAEPDSPIGAGEAYDKSDVSSSYTLCHTNCHQDCHSSRGWR